MLLHLRIDGRAADDQGPDRTTDQIRSLTTELIEVVGRDGCFIMGASLTVAEAHGELVKV